MEQLSLSAMKVANAATLTSSHGIAGEPDLRYVVYIPFLHKPGYEGKLEEVARAFTSAVMLRLAQGSTVKFDFRTPPEPTLSSIVESHKSYMATKPDAYIGALKDIGSWTIPPKRKFLPEETPTPSRLYPCTREEELPLNLQFERYETFIVILDKPGFIDGTGVLFLLTDGGRLNKLLPSSNPLHDSDPDFVETQVWRSTDMSTVVRRLAMLAAMPVWREEDWVEDEDAAVGCNADL
ncbi:hypothetical protein LTR36_000058 [Oleoguttula mirabilis]|uniref:Uncharacterized protein n=1 Tax=Oleoguttula mirabilis TaxID=1507867 RepID=A0AAV9JXV4_9PEZI|nr:hypothetical protein LTR36_000058 [Oleoguttula mirabilis]